MKTVLFVLLFVRKLNSDVIFDDNPILRFYPCLGSDILYEYQYDPPSGQETTARVTITDDDIILGEYNTIDSYYNDASVELETLRLSEKLETPSHFNMKLLVPHDTKNITLIWNGDYDLIPYLYRLKINGVPKCVDLLSDFLDNILLYKSIARELRTSVPDKNCGRRKVDTSNTDDAKRADWPWHADIYRKEENNTLICGGTLISKLYVLTAAHCATVDKNPVTPDILSVVLGKNSYEENNEYTQEIEIFNVIVHEEFGSPKPTDNDIALLKLKTDVLYNDRVQPACLWSKKVSIDTSILKLSGTIQLREPKRNNSVLSSNMKQASLPLLSDQECAKNNATLLNVLLNEKIFCAAWVNETSPLVSSCDADSGRGVMVSVPAANSSVWYLRGVVPQRSVCRSHRHALFIDLAKYEDWIQKKIFSKIINVARNDINGFKYNPRIRYPPGMFSDE